MDSTRISSVADDFLTWASDDKVARYLIWNTVTTTEETLTYIQQAAIPHPCEIFNPIPSVFEKFSFIVRLEGLVEEENS
ncbi:hypothetical protein MIMGU_mgv11b024397mg [Erythranthe guttata]|uniref:Uncharacterized protein n=1 Tax=Erythranthe guttata TaxID=4155 RepID=A0A022QSA4_ERYGU|nr:hypothetical protein MIMGU_mgv11b024397mg [Erythranthe guttata]